MERPMDASECWDSRRSSAWFLGGKNLTLNGPHQTGHAF